MEKKNEIQISSIILKGHNHRNDNNVKIYNSKSEQFYK